MHLVMPGGEPTSSDHHVDLSFREASSWLDLPPPASTGGNVAFMLLGHETDGPFMVLSATTPTEMEAPRGPAHGHESDTWRISLIGTSPMGLESYGPGEFRWQIGGRPYGPDGYASGPHGGYHLVMFGDRRGFATQPTNPKHIERYEAQDSRAAAMFGIDVPDVYPDNARGVVTDLGTLDKAGKVNGSFAHAEEWPQVSPGVRASAGIMGHHDVGPLIVCVRAAAGAKAQESVTLGTEVLVMVVAGSCTVDGCTYEQGDVRIQLPGTTLPSIIAGADGVDLCVVVADRSALADAPHGRLAAHLSDLRGALTA